MVCTREPIILEYIPVDFILGIMLIITFVIANQTIAGQVIYIDKVGVVHNGVPTAYIVEFANTAHAVSSVLNAPIEMM